jgi:hypothetical protein
MPEPTLFISHKHSDSRIAQVVAAFCQEKSNNAVTVHLSSSPDFKGPKIGRGLNAQLRQALWDTDVLILIYTSSTDQDWSYCMWECGVANDSQSPETNIIVFQCGSDYPAPFNDVVRVNVRNLDHIKLFVKDFLRDPNFFPALNGTALAPRLTDSLVESAAKLLYDNISAVLPPLDDGLAQEWPTWPYLRIEMPRPEVDKMEQANEAERVALSHQLIKDFGVIVESDSRAASLFGLAGFPTRMRLDALLKTWKDKNQNAEATWFDSVCEQIMMGAARGFPVIRWTPIKEAGGESDYTPVLSRIKPMPYAGAVQFDIYFYNLSDPRAVPVTAKMIPIGEFFYKKLGQIDPKTLKLRELIDELSKRQLNRVPIMNKDAHPMYIVHRSMIDQFIVNKVMSATDAVNPNDLTLDELLANQEMKNIFENTFVVIGRQATLAEAQSAMLTRPGCSDIFVTAKGDRNEPVQGWLTNVDIARST